MADNQPELVAINEELGHSFDDLINRCEAYKQVLLKRKHDIAEKINSQVVGTNSNMVKTLSKVQEERLAIVSLRKEVEQLKSKYAGFKKETESVRTVFQKLIEDLKYKCNRMTYFTCLQCITSRSNKMRTDLMSKRETEAVKSYTILCELSLAMSAAPSKHLVSYITRVINYWHSILETFYSEDFEITLKQMNWPFTMSEITDNAKLNNFKQQFQRLANMLIKVQLPKNDYGEFNEQLQTAQLLEHYSHVPLPIIMLLVPFRKRFFYHFTGKKQTNKPDKPEWFLSRILSWIRDYRTFVVDWLGPVYTENGKRAIDSQHDFTIGLLQFVVIKLDSDLSHFQLEDVVFSHIVDETLAFEHELRKVYSYPNDYPSVTEVLTQAQIFFKWINMERKYAHIKMDEIIQNKEQWKILVYDSQYCMTVCADGFLTLLNTMSDRYSILRQPRHKLQFLKLQTDLLEEFRQNIIDGDIESNEHLSEMLCTLHYISYTLYNWGTNMHFLSLLNYKCELENEVRSRSESEFTEVLETADTVFDDSIRLYNLGIDSLLNCLTENIMTKVKYISKQYKRDRWHIMDSLIDENKYSITDSGWVMYETFTENLNTLNKSLPTSLFNKCWPILATKMSTFLFNDVLLANMFNRGGAQHFLCDIRYKLLPIFSKYTAKPSIYIERLLEACRVLNFEPNFKPVILKRNEVSEILLRRIEHGNALELG
ncbi:RAD50-interacting protein 1 [Metopolophium dirhodum]|uniref:RAD50-interacting protein 1 n=1 Tax=Metopolophium dirhodum TaxID=44670 RepID=UPI0029905219|nr:RAD50-interacting protein 1 [Metopolophium dirhodum]XP_060856697.1 RAD50-interacting protein 1 [Metopolophium dirhodum]